MRKKITSLTALGLAMVLGLTACGSKEETASTGGGEAAENNSGGRRAY